MTQLVTLRFPRDPEPQVLNGMAPAQRHGDISGARDMCVSSYTLARSLGDLPSQIDALRAMDLVLIRCGPANTWYTAIECTRISRLCCMPRLCGAQTRMVTFASTNRQAAAEVHFMLSSHVDMCVSFAPVPAQ